MSNVTEDLTAKRLQLFKEAVPSMSRMGLLFYPDAQRGQQVVEDYREAAARHGMETVVLEVRNPAEIDAAVSGARAMNVDGLAAAPDSMIFNARHRIAALALEHHLPTTGANVDTVTAGGLIAYGPNHADIFRRSAATVHKILRGEKPSDIPVQQPVTFLLRINLRTAKSIGLEIAPTLLARADEVIE